MIMYDRKESNENDHVESIDLSFKLSNLLQNYYCAIELNAEQ